MRRNKKSLTSKADSADKKLGKMSLGDKNFRQQIDLLSNLREQISTLDVEITNEEASLGDWKRTMAREWMGVLFGGLLECSKKGAVVATFGHTIVGHVPTEKTQPGRPRAHYSGHSQVGPLVVEAEQELHNISFVSEVGGGTPEPPSVSRIDETPGPPFLPPRLPIRPVSTHQLAQEPVVVEETIVPGAGFARSPRVADDTQVVNRCVAGRPPLLISRS